jgi:hypothetical protein
MNVKQRMSVNQNTQTHSTMGYEKDKRASVQIKIYRGLEGFNKIENDWNCIVDELNQKSLFHMPQWYKSYINASDDKCANLNFFVMYREEYPIAIFPLETFEKTLWKTRMKLRGLKIPQPWETPFGDFIYEKEEVNKPIINILLNNIESYLGHKWDYIELPESIFEDSSIWFSLKDDRSALIHSQKQGNCYYLQAKSYEEVKKKFSRNFKKSLRNARNRLNCLGNVEFLFLRAKDDVNWALQDLIKLEGSGWKGKEGTSIKDNQSSIKFFKELRVNFSESEQFEIELLRINNKCIAGLLCIFIDDTAYAMKVGYDEKYSYVSPGVLLLDEVIKRYSNDTTVKTINFMSGYATAERWRPLPMDVFNILIYNKSILGLIYSVVRKYEIINKARKGIMLLKKSCAKGRRKY